MTIRIAFAVFLATILVPLGVIAAAPIASIVASLDKGGWTFDNGQEFPGAVGRLEMVNDDKNPTLQLHGEFSGGGNYVQAEKSLPDLSVDSVSSEIKVPSGVGKVTTRLIDGSEQCHQLNIRLNDREGWKKHIFPVTRYFDSLQSGAPMDIVTKYEQWGGANDGRWHQPAKLFVVLAGKGPLREGRISLRNVVLIPTPSKTDVATTIRLDDFGDQDVGVWEYYNGDEFPGASGALARIADPTNTLPGWSLTGDFSRGGGYVGARRKIPTTNIKQTRAIRWKVRSNEVTSYSIRLVDSSDQTHQRREHSVVADGKWHDVVIDPHRVAGGEHGGEHGGGMNDGAWHVAAKLIEITLSARSASSSPMKLDVTDIRTDVIEAFHSSRSIECRTVL